MRRAAMAALAGLVLVPATARAATLCAPSDPAGFYACASVSVAWTPGAIVLSVQNLDTWDSTLSSVVGGYRIKGVGLVGVPSLAPYLTGTVGTAVGGGAFGVNSPSPWTFDLNIDGIFVHAGADAGGMSNSIQGCEDTGSLVQPYYDTCVGLVTFSFGTTGLSEADFNAMELAFGMRGIAGPNDASFRCFGDECIPGQVVPEPITMVLLGTGLVGLGAVRRRRGKRSTNA